MGFRTFSSVMPFWRSVSTSLLRNPWCFWVSFTTKICHKITDYCGDIRILKLRSCSADHCFSTSNYKYRGESQWSGKFSIPRERQVPCVLRRFNESRVFAPSRLLDEFPYPGKYPIGRKKPCLSEVTPNSKAINCYFCVNEFLCWRSEFSARVI